MKRFLYFNFFKKTIVYFEFYSDFYTDLLWKDYLNIR